MTWSIEDARTKRRVDGQRRARLRTLVGRHLESPLRSVMSAAGAITGNRNYFLALDRVARRMNRYQKTAFKNYEPTGSDIVCSAYFKAGTNWVMHICYQITQLGNGQFDHIQDEIAWPDAAEPRYWRALSDSNAICSPSGRRVIKSHLPADLIPLQTSTKYIAVTRDPLDCAASGFHFYANLILGPATPPPDVWLDYFALDRTFYGPWHHFTASWWAERNRKNVLFLTFEDLKARPHDTIVDIAQFLEIELTPDQLEDVIKNTSIEAMRKINDRFTPVRQNIWSNHSAKIVRKGAMGDGHSLFSREAIELFRKRTAVGLEREKSDFPHYDLLPGH